MLCKSRSGRETRLAAKENLTNPSLKNHFSLLQMEIKLLPAVSTKVRVLLN